MGQSISTILIAHYFAKDISQTRFVASYKKWRQKMKHIILSLSTMGKTLITAIFTHCAHDRNNISGLPP